MPHKRLELLYLSAPDPKSGVSTNFTNGAVIAVREGVEPSCCDSVKNKIAGFVVNPYSITYFILSAHETSGCVCRCVHNFTTLQYAEVQGFEPQIRFHV